MAGALESLVAKNVKLETRLSFKSKETFRRIWDYSGEQLTHRGSYRQTSYGQLWPAIQTATETTNHKSFGNEALMPLGRLVHVATLVASWYWQTQHLADFRVMRPGFSVEVGESDNMSHHI